MTVFVLRDAEIAKRMVAHVKMIAGPAAAAGRPVQVTIEEYGAKRSSQANARYWALLEDIAEQAVIDGKRFSRETWHEWAKSKFAPLQDGPGGLMPTSTAQMTKEAFSAYVTKIEVYAVETLGVEFAAV